MIVMAAIAIGVLSALWSPTRWQRLARLDLHHIWLVWFGFLTQVIVFQFVARHMDEGHVKLIHVGTYAILVAFIVVNRHIPGAWMIALGTAFNLTAIVANGGAMPASRWALAYSGKQLPTDTFQNSAPLADPKLLFLGDVFGAPPFLPLANVFSVGDVLMVVGGTYLAHVWCSRPHDEARSLTSLLPLPPALADRITERLRAHADVPALFPGETVAAGRIVIQIPTLPYESADAVRRSDELVGAGA